MSRELSFLLALWAAGWTATPCFSQNLADLAREERAKRERMTPSGKVYTNDDLTKFGHFSAGDETKPSVTSSNDKPLTPGTGPAQPAKVGGGASAEPETGEQYWSKRFIEAKAKLQSAKSRQESLQTKLNDYSFRLLNQSDVYDREHLYSPLIAQTQEEIARNKIEVAGAESELDSLRDELRKSGNPASWENSQMALQAGAPPPRSGPPQTKDQQYWQRQLTQIDKRYDELIAPLSAERFQLINRQPFVEGGKAPVVGSTAMGLPPRVIDLDIQIKELNQRRQQEKERLAEEAVRQGALPGWFR